MITHLCRYLAILMAGVWLTTALNNIGQTMCEKGPYVMSWPSGLWIAFLMVGLIWIGFCAGRESEQQK